MAVHKYEINENEISKSQQKTNLSVEKSSIEKAKKPVQVHSKTGKVFTQMREEAKEDTSESIKEYFKVTDEEIKNAKEKLQNNLIIEKLVKKGESIDDMAKTQILYDKLMGSTKNAKAGDEVLYWDKNKMDVDKKEGYKDSKVYVANKVSTESVMGEDLAIRNKDNSMSGYISGGFNGRAVLKKYYDEYKKLIKGI